MQEIDFFAQAEKFTRETKKYPMTVRADLDETAKEMLKLLKANKF